jgi:energy-coupling factor transport system ATP-binding protein
MNAISCAEVVFDYPGGVRALDGINLTIETGERVAIVGQNGSGKTTLVRHFNGLLRPSAGRVLIMDADARTARIAQLAAQVGLAFQDPDRQIFSGSVEVEVAFGARNVGLGGAELEAAVDESLESVGLAGERKTNPYDLGYSRRKLLTIASVLAMRTPIVVLDEPTTGQDARGVETIEQIVDHLGGTGRTVVTISHDMRFVAESFGRIVVMRSGRIVLDGSPAEVFAEANWPVLRSTNLQPTYPATVGARIGLGSTATDRAFVDAFVARSTGLG